MIVLIKGLVIIVMLGNFYIHFTAFMFCEVCLTHHLIQFDFLSIPLPYRLLKPFISLYSPRFSAFPPEKLRQLTIKFFCQLFPSWNHLTLFHFKVIYIRFLRK